MNTEEKNQAKQEEGQKEQQKKIHASLKIEVDGEKVGEGVEALMVDISLGGDVQQLGYALDALFEKRPDVLAAYLFAHAKKAAKGSIKGDFDENSEKCQACDQKDICKDVNGTRFKGGTLKDVLEKLFGAVTELKKRSDAEQEKPEEKSDEGDCKDLKDSKEDKDDKASETGKEQQ